MRSVSFRQLTTILCLMMLLCSATTALSQSDSSSVRLPGNANTVMTINVAKMLQSPMAIMGWRSSMFRCPPRRELALIGREPHCEVSFHSRAKRCAPAS